MANAKKAKVTLGQVPLAATSAIAWRFVSGVAPYTTTFYVAKDSWPRLKSQIGEPLQLKIVDSRGVETTINQVYILHEAPSDSPARVAFVVADKRWKWPYYLVARDFNMPRKTGDRTVAGGAERAVPVETQTIVDRYDYLAYSLKGEQGEKWTAKDAIEEVLRILHPQGAGTGGFKVESWPIKDTSGGTNTGEFVLQGVTLRDSGDAALARALGYVPGADVYVNADGVTVVFDAADLDDLKDYYAGLPADTWAGEVPAWIDRKKIRPKKVEVFYQREVEVLLEFDDDYRGFTSAQPSRNAPFIENVIPTVDPTTDVRDYDPESGAVTSKPVPAGTWVEVSKWLEAMDADRPDGSLPWTFETIKIHWLKGDLEGVLGARGKDFDATGNVAMRVAALRQHFRQTFRINRRFVERVRSIRAVRVGLLDPVTGARAPAAVWGQACIISSTKGKYMAARGTDDVSKLGVFRNVDYLNSSGSILQAPPGPTRVNIVDEEIGVFRLDWIASPYGTVESFVPCNLVDDQGFNGITVVRDLAQQENRAMGPAMIVEGGTNGIFLAPEMSYRVLLTIVPAAPNNERQFHKVEVDPRDIASIFRSEFRISNGDGPTLQVFVPPGELTARFALSSESAAARSVGDLLGLNGPPTEAGLDGPVIPGYTLTNEGRVIKDHAASVAAEMLSAYADNVQGALVTRIPETGKLKLTGNVGDVTVRVSAAPSAKVDAVHNFPGQSRSISRLAVMPESTRQIVLGIVPFKA